MFCMKIILEPTNLHWIKGKADDPNDLCAHGNVLFQINDDMLLSEEAGEWTVSASALYLLRTLSRNHTSDSRVGEHLFPCCGHALYDIGAPDVLIIGCSIGRDFEIRHIEDEVQLQSNHYKSYLVDKLQWKHAVCSFSDKVRAFYETSSPKKTADGEDKKGFDLFMQEWERRRREDDDSA